MVRHPADRVRVNPRELLLKMSKLQAQSSGLPMNLIECERNKPSRNQQMPRVASIRKCPHSNGPMHRITQITITAIFRQCALAHKGQILGDLLNRIESDVCLCPLGSVLH
ncbi:MAG: hypothetical protein DMG06_06570 [Acidobacteria bacterium]|nr:MAG: hypothetical protein DMG06_06570 [Acidobacteriota bacterium]